MGKTKVPKIDTLKVLTPQKRGFRIDLKRDSYIIGFFGPKGSGKTLAMTYFALKAMILYKFKCWASPGYAIKFQTGKDGDRQTYESEPLDMGKFYSMDQEITRGLVCIDELPVFAESRASNRLQNRLIDYTLMQVRKRRLNFFYTSQNPEWVDKRIRWSTDIGIFCEDLSRIMSKGEKRGELIRLYMMDWSGQWTGRPYERTGKVIKKDVRYANKIWPVYDSWEVVDAIEASRGVELKLDKYVIGDVDSNGDGRYSAEEIEVFVDNMRNQGATEVSSNELWQALSLKNQGDRKKIGGYLKKAGVRKRQISTGDYVYIFN